MKLLFSFILTISLLFASSIDSKIKQNTKALKSKKNQYKKMDKQLATVAKKIFSAKKEQAKLQEKLATLKTNIQKSEAEFQHLQQLDKKYAISLEKYSSEIASKQQKFLKLVSENFSLALALEELKQPTPDSIMMKEVYQVYEKKNNTAIANLKKEISTLTSKKTSLENKKSTIQQKISTYVSERSEYEAKKKKQDKIVKELARDKAIYKKRFDKIKASRKSLERKLAKLKIIKQNEEQQAREEAEQQRQATASRVSSLPPKVVSHSSPPPSKYQGGKTISPLKGARLIKKFGTYIDPIYKFKIFNKSVTLKAPHAGSKIRVVLGGKIVFAENSGGMLGKVVIVDHGNGMHTIYAKLSRLAPSIHVGKELSKGTIIGKVDKSLMFEVTKNNKHINPMKLITL
jgi:septal ring factor EnvC (AmiA/AmiB activator)